VKECLSAPKKLACSGCYQRRSACHAAGYPVSSALDIPASWAVLNPPAAREWIEKLEQVERSHWSKNSQVGYNKVFGYFINFTRSASQAPAVYSQTSGRTGRHHSRMKGETLV
jgi:hypothetical protein